MKIKILKFIFKYVSDETLDNIAFYSWAEATDRKGQV